jgi:hypothetical protein
MPCAPALEARPAAAINAAQATPPMRKIFPKNITRISGLVPL